jgi:DNA-binding response OmpR family regulator
MAKGKKTTVLVADDDPQILALVVDRLGKLGFEVFETSDGDEALSVARDKKPDAVVLDVMMPGRSGWEVCRSIREDDALSGTAIVMLTGIGERLNEMTSPLYGADDYLDKPFDFSDLERKLKGAIQRRRKG